MKKKVYYKLNRYKVAKVEVESVEQEQAVKILNRETDRFAKSEDTYYEKCSSLDEMYEETGFEPADDTISTKNISALCMRKSITAAYCKTSTTISSARNMRA